MILNKCYIESFGILEKRDFDFESGLNCIISDNGTGKSTLAAFIKAMLFGLNTDNKSDISKNERRKYHPWGGGRYGGSLTLTVDGVRYRIERDFGEKAAADKFRLYFADTGMPTDRYSENIGMEILGIDREGFERTLLLSERMITGEEGINSVRTKLSDLVGVDGDAGGSEEALNLLENKKKIYSRRRPTSEISLLDGRLAEKKTELEALKDEAATIEAVSEEISEERRKKADLDRRHGELLKAQSAAESAERVERDRIALNDKTKKLYAVREELRLHEDFFAEGVPTADEITKAEQSLAEARALRSSTSASTVKDELAELSSFFTRPTSDEEIESMEKTARSLSEHEYEAEVMARGDDSDAKEMRRIFVGEPPTEAEIKEALTVKKDRVGAVLIGIGAALAAVGIGLALAIHPLALLVSAVGIALAVLGAVRAKVSVSPEGEALMRRHLTGRYTAEEAKVELLSRRSDYERLAARRDSEKKRLDRAAEEERAILSGFVGCYRTVGYSDYSAAVKQIKKYHETYKRLTEIEGFTAAQREEKLADATRKESEAKAFLARYKTESDHPCEEIRERLTRRGVLLDEVARLENEVKELAEGLPEESADVPRLTAEEIDEAIRAVRVELDEVGKSLARLESREERLIERCESIPVVEGEIEALEERIARCEKSGGIVKKTMLYIEMAKARLTERYLGGTRTAFLDYQKTISGSEGDFAISSDKLALTKNDRGKTRELECYSRGTKDLYVLSLHLALADALYKDTSPFILLDDPFSALDDGKLERGKALIKRLAEKRQVIYLTPSTAREIK